jgi:hypothetical protein
MLSNIGLPGLMLLSLLSGGAPIVMTGIVATQVVQPIPMSGPAPFLVAPLSAFSQETDR